MHLRKWTCAHVLRMQGCHAGGVLRPASAAAQDLRFALLHASARTPDAGHSRDSAASEQHTVLTPAAAAQCPGMHAAREQCIPAQACVSTYVVLLQVPVGPCRMSSSWSAGGADAGAQAPAEQTGGTEQVSVIEAM